MVLPFRRTAARCWSSDQDQDFRVLEPWRIENVRSVSGVCGAGPADRGSLQYAGAEVQATLAPSGWTRFYRRPEAGSGAIGLAVGRTGADDDGSGSGDLSLR